ncbi:MAG: hypothetical protein ABW328_20320 [Ilumatobacteraceae bacterium]
MTVSDDELLELVARALGAAEPVPDHVLAGARAALTWRTIDQELAELVFDSASELSGVRASDTARQLTFRSPGVEIEVMVVDDDSRRIVGQLIPPDNCTIQLAAGDLVAEESTDHLGRFTFEGVAPGPVRITIVDPSGTHIVSTEWVVL